LALAAPRFAVAATPWATFLAGDGHFVRHLFGGHRDLFRTVLGSASDHFRIVLDGIAH